MHQSPKGRDPDGDNLPFKRLTVTLIDEQQWSYLQKRYHMTPRELQVAKLVCQGFDNKKIAKALKIKQGTVKTHLRSIYRKVRTKSKITMLLRLVHTAAKFSAKRQITPIPIVDIEKPRKRPSAPVEVPEKKK